MLSISNPLKGSSSGRYYTALAREDYYLNGGEPMGQWFGESARRLGLKGTVDKDDLRDLLEGYSPGKERELVLNCGDPYRQSGWDLTFSPPKSFSTLWSQVAPELREELQAIQQEAVKEALTYLEQEAGLTRRGKFGYVREEVGFIAALFEHGSSRDQDPQPHTHAVLLNICIRDDLTAGAIVSKGIYRHKMAAGSVYRLVLANGLQRLGLALTKTKDGFEIANVPERLMASFSKRRLAILKEMGDRTGGVAAKEAAHKTRKRKSLVPRSELFRIWEGVGQAHGWTRAQAVKLFRGKRPLTEESISPAEVADAIDRLTQRQAHFSLRELLQVLATDVLTRNVPLRNLLQAVSEASKKLVRLGDYKSELQYTTQTMLDLEKGLLQCAVGHQKDRRHVLYRLRVEWTLLLSKLSDEQKQAIRHITRTPGRVKVLAGYAGTGKSQLLKVANQAWTKAGRNVVGVALSGKAADGLQKSSDIQSVTLAHLMKKMSRTWWTILPGVSVSCGRRLIAPNAPQWSFAKGKRGLPQLSLRFGSQFINHKTVVVIDEAGMVGTEQLKQVLEFCAKAKAKVVLVGDGNQLPAIEAGAPFEFLGQRVGQAKLTEIKRQCDDWAKEVVREFAEGDPRKALKELHQRGAVKIGTELETPKDMLVKDWLSRGSPQGNLIIAATNADVDDLNSRVHSERTKRGDLGRKELKHNGESFSAGDRVIFGKNSKLYGVNNGTLGTVEAVRTFGRKRLTIRVDGAKDRIVVPLADYPHVRLGYAATTHKAQSATTTNTFVLVSGSQQGREMTYVEASRARGDTLFYVHQDDARQLSHLVDRSRKKVMATDIREGKFAEPARTPGTQEPPSRPNLGGANHPEGQKAPNHQRSTAKSGGNQSPSSGKSQSQSRSQ